MKCANLECGVEFTPKNSNQLYCSLRCSRLVKRRRQGVRPWSERVRGWKPGDKISHLTLVEYLGVDKAGHQRWRCLCDCGEFCESRADKIKSGRALSCGCIRRARETESVTRKKQRLEEAQAIEAKTQLAKDIKIRANAARHLAEEEKRIAFQQNKFTYNSWSGARGRCLNPFHRAWPDYGGRGIRMCDYWVDSFENFFKQMGPRPLGKTLDRINYNGNYELSNCRWATPSQQAKNVRKRIRTNRSTFVEEQKIRKFLRSVAWG